MALSVALIEPQIPPNTGNIARLCAASDTSLHLIQPMAFTLDDTGLKRAGLDYWTYLDLWVHDSWRNFRSAISRERCLYFSTHGARSYIDAPFTASSVLVFGSETRGMPQRILEKHPEQTFRIPMVSEVRSLNLSTSVGIVLYEALRKLGHLDTTAHVAESRDGDHDFK